MNEDSDDYPDYLAGSDSDDSGTSIEELQDRVDELEDRIDTMSTQLQASQSAGIGLYGLGAIIAVVLSWSRNASILWCILHGIFSWIYVIYFAFTR